jgi:hypothetical protein
MSQNTETTFMVNNLDIDQMIQVLILSPYLLVRKAVLPGTNQTDKEIVTVKAPEK